MSNTEFQLFALVLMRTTLDEFQESIARYKRYAQKNYSLQIQVLFPIHWIPLEHSGQHHPLWGDLKKLLIQEYCREYNLEFNTDPKCYKNHHGLHYAVTVESKIRENLVLKRLYEPIEYEIDPPIGSIIFVKGYLYAGGLLENLPRDCITGTGAVYGYPIYTLERIFSAEKPVDSYTFIIQLLLRNYTPFQIWTELQKINSSEIILNYINFLDENLGIVLYELLHAQSFETALEETYTGEQKLLIAGLAAIKFKPTCLREIPLDYDYIYQLVTYCP